jgi:hypothetical protein
MYIMQVFQLLGKKTLFVFVFITRNYFTGNKHTYKITVPNDTNKLQFQLQLLQLNFIIKILSTYTKELSQK